MEASELSFHLAEYAALRAEIDQRIAALMDVEREVVIGSFVLYAWLLGRERKSIDLWARITAVWLPVLLSGISYLRLEANRQRIRQIGDYLSELEAQLAYPALKGWEHVLTGIRETHPDLSTTYYGMVGLLYFVFTVIFAVIGTLMFYLLNAERPVDTPSDHSFDQKN
jgi:nucleoside permease NupC